MVQEKPGYALSSAAKVAKPGNVVCSSSSSDRFASRGNLLPPEVEEIVTEPCIMLAESAADLH